MKSKMYPIFAFPCCRLLSPLRLLSIFLFLFSFNVSAQLVGDATVKANFGVEADVYANVLQFPNADVPPIPLPSPLDTDDWFGTTPSLPGDSGLNKPYGVIDQTNAAAIEALITGTPGNNYAFEKRQSVTTPTFPFPYPIVDGYLWIDAVYGRDHNSAQGSSDLSIFGGSGDKNSDNPNTWVLGTGSIPQKDDIIDVYAHLRGIGPKAPTPQDPRPFTELWAFAGGSLRETNGSKHIDFEFFRTLIDYSPGDVVFGNTGNDGGRTAWDFDATGNILIPGTLIVSIDYEGGGTKPDVRIRVWMNQADIATFNTLPNRPFNIDASSFEQGLDSGVYGYVRIEALNNAVPYIFGRVNREAATLGPPWGTIEGQNAAFQDDYKEFQFVEIGINLTAFGLDRRGEDDPCSNILGSLLVKTRSSAGGNSDSFTSELKDFAGPYIFGNSTDPSVDLVGGGTITCTNTSVTLTANLTNPMTSPGTVSFSFYGPDNDNDPNNGYGPLLQGPSADNTIDIIAANGAGTYTVVVDALAFPGCSRIDRVDVNVVTCDPVNVTGPTDANVSQCDYENQAAVDAAFAAWLAQFQIANDGCEGNAEFSGDPRVAPSLCTGGAVNVTYSIADACTSDTATATFTLPKGDAVDVTGPADANVSQCDYANQAAVDAAFAAWLAQFQTVNDGCNGQGGLQGQYSPPSLCEGGSVTASYRIADNCTSDTATATFTLTEAQELTVTCPPDVILTCSDDPQAAFTAWINGFTFSGGCNPTASDLSGYEMPKAGQSISITYTVQDNCDLKSCTSTFEVPTCSEIHCTYTQGYYGELNGSACTPDGQPTYDHQIMVNAINQAGGWFNFGSTGTGNYFTLKASDVYGNANPALNNVFVMLPGGGMPRALVGFATYDQPATWSDNDPLNASGQNKGRINNNLLSQTMALFFNLSVDSGLSSVQLKSKFATVDVECSTGVPNPRSYQEFTIPASVINYLNANYAGGATVGNLFILANKALGGENIGGLSHSNINMAVDAINRGFDECRLEVPVVIDLALTPTGVANEPIFTAYPVPFRDVLNIKYDFDYKSDVKIEIFDSKGSLLMTENDTDAYFNKEISVRPRFNRGDGQLFFVKLITNQGVSIKKVISEK